MFHPRPALLSHQTNDIFEDKMPQSATNFQAPGFSHGAICFGGIAARRDDSARLGKLVENDAFRPICGAKTPIFSRPRVRTLAFIHESLILGPVLTV
jgi:hypothetical protein